MDGATDVQIVLQIVMPLAKPSIVTTALQVLIYVWNEYIYATTFLTGEAKYTLAAGLNALQATEMTGSWPVFSAAAITVSLPVLIIFFVCQKLKVIVLPNLESLLARVLFQPRRQQRSRSIGSLRIALQLDDFGMHGERFQTPIRVARSVTCSLGLACVHVPHPGPTRHIRGEATISRSWKPGNRFVRDFLLPCAG